MPSWVARRLGPLLPELPIASSSPLQVVERRLRQVLERVLVAARQLVLEQAVVSFARASTRLTLSLSPLREQPLAGSQLLLLEQARAKQEQLQLAHSLSSLLVQRAKPALTLQGRLTLRVR